jgi:hypothetical protein
MLTVPFHLQFLVPASFYGLMASVPAQTVRTSYCCTPQQAGNVSFPVHFRFHH